LTGRPGAYDVNACSICLVLHDLGTMLAVEAELRSVVDECRAMTMDRDRAGVDARARILVTAERLFREIGYRKITVADIARLLKMSPANVYRFFGSKRAIQEAVARRLMGEIEQAAIAIAECRLKTRHT